MASFRVVACFALAALGVGCASIVRNDPVNVPMTAAGERALVASEQATNSPAFSDDLLIGLAFSGGGTRAAAFSYGVLTEMDKARITVRGQPVSLLDRLDFVSGVSGGSVMAAYYGLKKRAALADFREKFLLRNAEESLTTDVNVLTMPLALSGGINDADRLPRWLDQNLFHGATLGSFRETRRPRIWINASDIYDRTTFVFGRTAFSAICSDLDSYPIANAVAASAAVPLVFAPVVIKAYPNRCSFKLPPWILRAQHDADAPPMLRTFAEAIVRYRSGAVPYIKLLDGGLVDNYGISGFTIARLSAPTAYGPLTPQQAVRLRRALFLIVDAGRGPSGNWVQTAEGPAGVDLVMAAADTAIDAGTKAGLTAFQSVLSDWEHALVRWRCGLSAAERRKLGAPARWNCRDLKISVDRLGFDQFDGARAAALNAVPTRFKLPQAQVDLVVAAGADALRDNRTYQSFLAELSARPTHR